LYAYAGGDPVSNSDPLGLYLIVIGNTAQEQAALQKALNIVGGTQRGYELIQTLQNSPDIHVLTNAQNGNAYYLNQVISVDPKLHPEINVGTDPLERRYSLYYKNRAATYESKQGLNTNRWMH
jgi:hypothetical protein